MGIGFTQKREKIHIRTSDVKTIKGLWSLGHLAVICAEGTQPHWNKG